MHVSAFQPLKSGMPATFQPYEKLSATFQPMGKTMSATLQPSYSANFHPSVSATFSVPILQEKTSEIKKSKHCIIFDYLSSYRVRNLKVYTFYYKLSLSLSVTSFRTCIF